MRFLFFLAFGSALFAQPFSIGVKIGAPVTDAFNIATGSTEYRNTSLHLVIGPTAEVRLPLGFAIEVDALYQHLSYDYATTGFSSHATASSWEFPVLAKYRAPFPVIKPYVEGGLAFNHIGSLGSFSSILKHSSTAGIVLGAGVEVKVLKLRVSPEIRYTRWAQQSIQAIGSVNTSTLMSNQNQADLLVGFSF